MSVARHYAELWRHRALVDVLVRREVKARYRGSVLGWAWTLLNPFLLLAIYWLVFTEFTRAVQVPRYPVFLLAGVLPWGWVSTSVTAGSGSIVQGAGLVTRVCMPPQVLPAVTVLSNLVNLVLAIPFAIAAGALAGTPPGPGLLLLPVAIAASLPAVYGVSLACAVLTVRWRDVGFLVQHAVLVWFFLTPVVYPLSGLPRRWAELLSWNPATGLVLPFQQALHEGRLPDAGPLCLAAGWSLAIGAGGAWLAERTRGTLAESL